MIDERFAKGVSWIHQLDPRLKVIITVLMAVVIATGNNLVMLTQALILALLLLLSAGLDFRLVLKRILIINFFIFFIWFMLPFTYGGTTLFQLGPLTASREGVFYALRITLRSNAVMLIIITLIATSTISALMHALRYLYLPEKLVYLLFLIYRYLHVLGREFKKLNNSILLRGFKSRTGIHSYKTYAYLIGMLFIKSYERSQRVYEAMLCRGFKGKFYIMDDFAVSFYDYIFLITGLLAVAWFILLEKGVVF